MNIIKVNTVFILIMAPPLILDLRMDTFIRVSSGRKGKKSRKLCPNVGKKLEFYCLKVGEK